MELPFATLEPANALAKMAFSDEYDTILRDQQNNTANDVLPTDCFQVASEQRYDPEVLRYHREMTKQSEADFSESATELDTDTEIDAGDLGTVWTGCYVLQLENAPSQPNMGWIAGKGPYADISLCTKAFAKRHNLNIRSFHARFNFDVRNGAFFIVSITSSPLAGLGVNGISVTRQLYVLNQHNMKVRVGLLEYNFKYTEYASSDEFMRRRGEYLITKLRALNSVVFDMPTPRRNTRTIGQWTLGDPLGKGNTGRVFLATNTKNETVAVKIMELNSTSKRSVDNEIAICRALTALAKNHDNGERIVRLKETIDPREEATRASCVFDEVGIVLEPMTPMTLSDLIGERTSGYVAACMTLFAIIA